MVSRRRTGLGFLDQSHSSIKFDAIDQCSNPRDPVTWSDCGRINQKVFIEVPAEDVIGQVDQHFQVVHCRGFLIQLAGGPSPVNTFKVFNKIKAIVAQPIDKKRVK